MVERRSGTGLRLLPPKIGFGLCPTSFVWLEAPRFFFGELKSQSRLSNYHSDRAFNKDARLYQRFTHAFQFTYHGGRQPVPTAPTPKEAQGRPP